MTEVREPSSIIEMAEMIQRRIERALETGVFKDSEWRDGERAALIAGVLPDVDYYELGAPIVEAVRAGFENEFVGKATTELVLHEDMRLPSQTCGFWAKGTNLSLRAGKRIRSTGGDRPEYDDTPPLPFMYLAQQDGNRVDVHLVSPYFLHIHVGAYVFGEENPLLLPDHLTSEAEQNDVAEHILTVAIVCSIINQPGFVVREPAGTRQERRAAARSGAFREATWSKVRWNVGEAVRQRLERDEPVRCMPLHYTRGHWRRGHEHWTNAVQRKDGGWYKWIDGYWSGHPAFGIRKAVHEPRIKEQVT